MNERGSILPLVLGFVVVGGLGAAAAVAAGDAFVQQRGLQAVCDGAAAAAAATALDLRRDAPVVTEGLVRFAEVQAAVDAYVARDPDRRDVRIAATVSTDRRTLSLTCSERRPVTFGTAFGKGSGVEHVAHSSVQSRLADGQ